MHLKEKYGKILVPMVTPFKADGELDFDAAAEVARRLVNAGHADSLILSGTTGEFHTMSFDERVKLFEVILESVGDTIPLIAGTGSASTKETLELTQAAEEIGFSLVMVIAPYYAKPNQQEILHHFATVADSTEVDIMLYNIPIFTGVNIDPATVAELSSIQNIVGIKEEAELNPKQITAFLNATGDDFLLYCGDDTMILESYAQGGEQRIGGIVSGASHLIGRQLRDLIHLFLAGNIEQAAVLQRQYYRLFKVMGQSRRVNPVALLKEAMKMVGYPAGFPRSPLSAGSPEEIAAVREVMEGLDLL